MQISTFAADGRRLRSYSEGAIERLLSLSLIVVKRNRRGVILAAHFRDRDGASPLARVGFGQRYIFQSRSESSGTKIADFEFKRLGDDPRVFCQVPLSCMHAETKPSAEVVSIASRPRYKDNRLRTGNPERLAA